MRRCDQVVAEKDAQQREGIPRRTPRVSFLSQKPAMELLDLIRTQRLNPQHLHRPERMNIVDTLRVEGWGQAKIAEVLRCSHRTVQRDVRKLKTRARVLVKDFTRERVAGETIAQAEGLRQKAIFKGDIALAWQITKELPQVVQSLGLLERAPTRFEGQVTIADLLTSAAAQLSDVDLRRS